MLENELIKFGGVKLLNSALLPGFTVLIVGGLLTWHFWKQRKKQPKTLKNKVENETLACVKNSIEVLMTEQRDLSTQMAQLQDKLLAFQNTESGTAITLQSGIDSLKTEQRDILIQIIRLQEKLLILQTNPSESRATTNNTSTNVLMNKASEPTKEPAKLAMFQRLIDDNVKLRQAI
jgi:predicted  nucleic acid-binding Zn-ribbon protein